MKISTGITINRPSQTAGDTDKGTANQDIGSSLAGKTIAIFMQSLAIGGAERIAINLAEGLIQQDIKVDLLLTNCSGAFLSEVPPQVTIIDLKGKRVLFSLFALVRYLRARRPDLLYSVLPHASLIAVWAVKFSRVKTPLVISIHNMLSTPLAVVPSIRESLIIKLGGWFFRSADAAICVSRGVEDDFIKTTGMPPQKSHVVYNPLVSPDLERKASEIISHPWFIADGPPVILAVGRLAVAKDYPTLLRAFSNVVQKRPARLLILGDGRERARIESLVKELGLSDCVQMPGFVKNPYAYMARARLLVLSSIWEGFANVLVEALACGTPVVSTNCKSGPREILEEGRFGRLVPVGDTKALSAAILETLQAPPDRALLLQRANDFTIDEFVRKYIHVFQSCLFF